MIANTTAFFLLVVMLAFSASSCLAESLENLIKSRPMDMDALKASYGTNAMPELTRLADDPTIRPYLANLMFAIGAVGGSEGTDFLLRFLLSRFDGVIERQELAGMYSIPVALGYRARQGDEKALEFLLAHHTPDQWRSTRLRWWGREKQGELLENILTHWTLLALAFVDNPAVDLTFEKIQHDLTPTYVDLRKRIRELPNLVKARKDHFEFRKSGQRKQTGIPDLYTNQLSSTRITGPDNQPIRKAPLSEENINALTSTALLQFQLISHSFLTQPLYACSARLADNGQPLIGAQHAGGAEASALLKGIERKSSVEKARTVLRDIQAARNEYGSVSGYTQLNETVIITIPLEGSRELAKKHFPRTTPSLTITGSGELAIIMVLHDGKWFWQPFGW